LIRKYESIEKYLPFIVILEEGEMGQRVYQFKEFLCWEACVVKRGLSNFIVEGFV
jgi:hypothetical protein